MLVVISDLHFEEVASSALSGCAPLDRNLPASAFESMIARIAFDADRNQAKRLDFVLAGDIFDLHRTQLWFQDSLRPYVACTEVAAGSPLETRILDILDEISKEARVSGSLAVFQRLANGQYLKKPGDMSSLDRFKIPVVLHYIPGNHDRLANATPAIRQKVSGLLGIQAPPGPFPNTFTPTAGGPALFVRHGHEYDQFNFAADHSNDDPFPQGLPLSEYNGPTFGDFITIDVVSRLPNAFRRIYPDPQIVADPRVLTPIYGRLLELDDVRPQSAVLEFLLDIPGSGLSEKEIWEKLKPVVEQILSEIHDHEFFRAQLKRIRTALIGIVKAALGTRFWRLGLPLWLMRFLAERVKSAGRGAGPERFACREQAVTSGAVRFLIAGHTHEPQVAPLGRPHSEDRYFIDTGTWRNRLLSPPGFSAFERVKSLTYVVVYSSDEDPGIPPVQNKQESFDYWSGYTQRWPL